MSQHNPSDDVLAAGRRGAQEKRRTGAPGARGVPETEGGIHCG